MKQQLLKLADDMDLNFEKEIKELTAQYEKEKSEIKASHQSELEILQQIHASKLKEFRDAFSIQSEEGDLKHAHEITKLQNQLEREISDKDRSQKELQIVQAKAQLT